MKTRFLWLPFLIFVRWMNLILYTRPLFELHSLPLLNSSRHFLGTDWNVWLIIAEYSLSLGLIHITVSHICIQLCTINSRTFMIFIKIIISAMKNLHLTFEYVRNAIDIRYCNNKNIFISYFHNTHSQYCVWRIKECRKLSCLN